MEREKVQVSVIGLGAMGREIALNLLKSSYEVTVWNRSPEPVMQLAEAGAMAADNPRQAFAADIVLTTLFDDGAVRSVLVDNNCLEGMSADAVHVCMSTISLRLSRELVRLHDAAHVSFVAAPMFGRPQAARAAQLNILLAGADTPTHKVATVLSALGRVWCLGTDPSHAQLAKIAGNAMIVEAWQTMSEAATVLNGHGADAEQFLSMMGETLFSSPIYRAYGPAIAAGEGLDAAALSLALKDNRLLREAAGDAEVAVPFADCMKDLLAGPED